jgi:hypothetical protein
MIAGGGRLTAGMQYAAINMVAWWVLINAGAPGTLDAEQTEFEETGGSKVALSRKCTVLTRLACLKKGKKTMDVGIASI